MSDSENSVPGLQAVDSEIQPYVDAADRLERTLDAQLQTIRNIDSRAGFIIRVVGILLGVVVSAASILATVSTNGGGGQAFSVVAAVAAGIAAIGLLGAMVAAVVTYLSSSPVAGLEHQTAALLSSAGYETDMETHLRRTIGFYAYALRANTRVIQVNAARFRLSLVALLVGLVYGTLAAALVVVQPGTLAVEIAALAVVTIAAGILIWYVLTGRYKVVESETETSNE